MVRIDKTTGLNAPASMGSASKKRAPKSGSAGKGGQIHVNDASALREKAKVLLSDISEVRMERIEEIRMHWRTAIIRSMSRMLQCRL